MTSEIISTPPLSGGLWDDDAADDGMVAVATPVDEADLERRTGRVELPDHGLRIDKWLAQGHPEFSRGYFQSLLEAGAVWVNGRLVRKASARVQAGDEVVAELRPTAQASAFVPEPMALPVVFEDEHLIVIDKPAGMVVHPAVGNITGTLVNALLHHCAKSPGGNLSGINGVARPGIVHRIDKDTSGLLVVAKSDAAHEGLAVQFAAHTVHRRYIAVCAGVPSPQQGTVNARIGRSDADRKKMTVLPNNSSRGKSAITHYKVLERLDEAAVIECRLETGRTHQVRVHCASIGHPLLGDPAYGRTPKQLRPVLDRLGFARQALHAAELGFAHPVTGEIVQFRSDLPPDMAELIDQLGGSYR